MKHFLPIWCVASVLTLVAPTMSSADNGDCGIPFTSGQVPKTSDSLFVLRAGVALVVCAPCVCDTDGSGVVSATDALLDLKVAVGQGQTLDCPPCSASGSCPSVVEWTTRAGDGPECDRNADCAAGICGFGRCRTLTDVDLGWTGAGHDADIPDGTTLRVRVDCPGTGGSCGDCAITNLDASDGSCRCANEPSKTCDEPFALDNDDCPACLGGAFVGMACASNVDCSAGTCSRRCDNDPLIVCTKKSDCGAGNCVSELSCSNGTDCNVDLDCTGTCTTGSACQCFDGPPLPASASGTALCLLSTFSEPLTGTINVDTGASRITKKLTIFDYNGSSIAPCPVCGGRCSNDAAEICRFDDDCGSGHSCVLDATPRDGIRGGVCVGGGNDGGACDVDAVSESFPARSGASGGGGTSLDCSPANGANANGPGFKVEVTESTAGSELPAELSCGGDSPDLQCPCLVCSTDPTVACSSNDDCAGAAGVCNSSGTAATPEPNACENHACTSITASSGECTTGPDDRFCDDFVSAAGRGIVSCSDNTDCDSTGGTCSTVQRRECFPYPIVTSADADPKRPRTAATFCLSAGSSGAKNEAIGLPGPARVVRQTTLASYCTNAPGVKYKPGTGGCP